MIGKGSYGVVCSALDTKTGEKVAIKRIMNVFDHVSDATRILREIKLLRLLRHPGASRAATRCVPAHVLLMRPRAVRHRSGLTADIVEIKHIMLPPSPREFKDIYVVFELMETDLHQARRLPAGARAPAPQGTRSAARLRARRSSKRTTTSRRSTTSSSCTRCCGV